jgi:hypothetical protein
MALQDILSCVIHWPGFTLGNTINPSLGAHSNMTGSGNFVAQVIQAPESFTVSHIGLTIGTATGSPTADIRIETVDASTGQPTGTLWATNTNIVTGTLSTGWAVHALTASASFNRGDLFALKVAYNSGTTLGILRVDGVTPVNYTTNNVPTHATTVFPWGLGTSSTTFHRVRALWPVNASSSANVNNTTAGTRRGLRFQVPFSCRIIGLRTVMPAGSTGDFSVGIWDDAGSEVSNSITAFDRSQFLTGGNGVLECLFNNPVTLSANTWYRAAIEPTSATNVAVYHVTVADQAIRSGLPGGMLCHLTTHTTAGGWVDSGTTTIPYIDIVIDQLDDGAGSGGVRQKVYGG